MKDDTSDLAEQLRNEEYLFRQGYRKKPCKCRSAEVVYGEGCLRCKGRGWVWEAPLMR